MVSDYCRKWVKYAQNDIAIAERELNLDINPRLRAYEAILYHCQQAVEKMLKAYLIYKGENPWGHDLEALRASCTAYDNTFNSKSLIGHCIFLTSFIAVRYPDFVMSIDASHAIRGLNSAKRVYDFVSKKLGFGRTYFN
jgi:HEPN domain-containing protein